MRFLKPGKNMSTVWRPYTQMQTAPAPLVVKSVSGSIITLEDNTKLIDAMGSWWTTCHGARHPKLVAAMEKQLRVMPHAMLGGLTHQPIIQLTEKLTNKLAPELNHAFYSESGSVAVEVALKMAYQFWLNQNQPHKSKFIHLKHGYHGDTFFAMSICDPLEGMHARFKHCLPEQYLIELPQTPDDFINFEKWLSLNHHTVAGLIIEPLVQGAGGMKFLCPQALHKLCEIVRKFELIIIFDEIFTGFGRTGPFFAYEKIGFVPDIICLGKALSGGMTPFAATIASDKIYHQFLSNDEDMALMHGPTFTGHALGAAAALASLTIFEETPWQENVKAIEAQLNRQLTPCLAYSCVQSVRCQGAIGVVELKSSLSPYMDELKRFFIERGVWCRPFGRIIYTTPSFSISPTQLNHITETIRCSVEGLAKLMA